jgi:myo-inositol 2-dehydrogenase / D-chiro-inositol 1-dehydrogenase
MASSGLGTGCSLLSSDEIGLGFIGLGTRCKQLSEQLRKLARGRIVAVADVDAGRRLSFVNELPTAVPAFTDYRELLERKDVEAVVISTPDHWHSLQVVHSCQAGKDVYCEKPMTFSIEEGKECIRAVRSQGRVLQVGQNQRSEFGGRFRKVCEWVRGGLLGEVERIETHLGQGLSWGGNDPDTSPPPGLDWNRWLGPAPHVPYRKSRCHDTFRWWYDYSGGKLADWGTHHNDIAHWTCPTDFNGPIRVSGEGSFPEPGGYDTAYRFLISYEFADSPTILCTSEEPHGVRFIGAEGSIWVDRERIETEPAGLAGSSLAKEAPRVYFPQEGHQSHIEDWLNCIKTRKDPVCPVEEGHKVATLCHLGNIAIRLARPIVWDPDREEIAGDDEAQSMTKRENREGYRS